jgi:hypothetical protein
MFVWQAGVRVSGREKEKLKYSKELILAEAIFVLYISFEIYIFLKNLYIYIYFFFFSFVWKQF